MHRDLHSFPTRRSSDLHLQRGVIAYRRKAEADGASAAEDLLVLLNFSESETEVWLPFPTADRKSTRLNSSHSQMSYAVFCLKKKSQQTRESHTRQSRQT